LNNPVGQVTQESLLQLARKISFKYHKPGIDMFGEAQNKLFDDFSKMIVDILWEYHNMVNIDSSK